MKRLDFSDKNSEYERLEEMNPQEKYIDAYECEDDYLYTDFRSLVLFEMNKKSEEEYSHKEDVQKILYKRSFESSHEKQVSTPLGRRTLEQFFARTLIENNDGVLKSPEAITRAYSAFTKRIGYFPKELVISNSEDLQKFFDSHEKKEIINFFVENFGYDFHSEVFRSRSFDSSIDSSWEEYKGKINFGRLVTHVTNQKIIQAPQFKHTKVLKVEIDNRKDVSNLEHYLTQGQMLKVITHEFGTVPFYAERSLKINGVLRAFFLFDSYIPDISKVKIERYFLENYKFKINIHKSDDYMTLPFSKETLVHGRYDEHHILGVIPESMNKIFERVSSLIPGKVRSIENLIGSIEYGKVIEFDSLIKNDEFSMESTSYGDGYLKFSYGRGTRHHNQVKLAVWCKGHSLSFNKYMDLCYELNSGSRDMSTWGPEKIQNQLQKYWKFAEKVAVPIQAKSSKTYVLSDDGKKIYSIKDMNYSTSLNATSTKDKFLSILTYYYNHKFTTARQQGVWKKYFLEDSLKLYRFLQRKKTYNESIGRKYKDTRFSDLDNGVLFPISIYNDVKKYLSLRVSVEKIISFFKEFNLLHTIEIDNRDYSYKDMNFARHYILLSDIEISNIYNSLYNNVFIDSSFSSIIYADQFHFRNNTIPSYLLKNSINFSPPSS